MPEITPTTVQTIRVTEENPSSKGNNQLLKVGSTVQAEVIDVKDGKIRLQIGTKTFIADAILATVKGEKIALKVLQSGDLPLLALQKNPPPEKPINDAIKVILPKQLPLQTLFSNLTEVKQSPIFKQLPTPLQKAVDTFLANLPTAKQLQTTEGLKQAVQQSGLQLEQKLRQMVQVAPRDLKANLLSLFTLIKPYAAQLPATVSNTPFQPPLFTSTPNNPLNNQQVVAQAKVAATIQHLTTPELMIKALQQLTDSALARVELKQLAHLVDDPGFLYNVELPFTDRSNIRLLHLKIEQEQQRQQKQQQRQWMVSLALDLDELGPLHARIALRQDDILTTFWAEEEQTAELIRKNLPKLYESLSESGFDVQQINCYHGEPPKPDETTELPTGLLDERI